MIADALERAASTDRNAIRDALSKTDIPAGPTMILPTDKLVFDENGQNPSAPLFIVQVQNGELIPVWPAKYAAKAIVMTK